MAGDQTRDEYRFDASSLPFEFTPHPGLLTYFVLVSLVAGPFFPIVLVPLYIRYATLRYQLDEEGIRMRRGMLFRREVSLAYRRIQDIHLSSNVLERWLGLGKVRIQTASGGAEAEITVEGLHNIDGLRDFLYERSRGSRTPEGLTGPRGDGPEASPRTVGARSDGDASLASVLEALVTEVRGLRADLASRSRP